MNWIFFLVWTGFLMATTQAGQFKLGKNPVHQTWNFKLENVKNQLQKDRGTVCFRVFIQVYLDGRTNKSQFEYQEITLILNIPNSPDKISSTRMRMQSSPAQSLKFTFCFAFSEKESGFAQPTITFACCLTISLGQNWKTFRWNCLIKDSKSPFSPL